MKTVKMEKTGREEMVVAAIKVSEWFEKNAPPRIKKLVLKLQMGPLEGFR